MTLETTQGQRVRATPDHLIPAGSCLAGAELAFTRAADVDVGDCVNTVDGKQAIVATSTAKVK